MILFPVKCGIQELNREKNVRCMCFLKLMYIIYINAMCNFIQITNVFSTTIMLVKCIQQQIKDEMVISDLWETIISYSILECILTYIAFSPDRDHSYDVFGLALQQQNKKLYLVYWAFKVFSGNTPDTACVHKIRKFKICCRAKPTSLEWSQSGEEHMSV